MRTTITIISGMAATAAAFPAMAGMKEEMLASLKRDANMEARGGIASLGDTIEGILGSVNEGPLDPSNIRPEPGFEFQAPGPNDSRGPCPGLNLLANHGYLPRNGLVTSEQVFEASARGFNMGTDLASTLIATAVLSDGSINQESWWLGTGPNGVGGLNRHSTVESDISPMHEDFYNGCGDNHHISSRLFADNVRLVAASDNKQFDIPTMAKQYAAQAAFSKKNNPSLYYAPFPMIVSVLAYNIYPRFFANGTNEFGGPADYESIAPIIGAKYDKKTDQFIYVPERFPENWYRRSFPYTATQATIEGFTEIYPSNPVLPTPSFLQLALDGTLNTANVFCQLYYGLDSVTPLALSGQEAAAAAKLSWAMEMMDKSFNGTLAGCNRDTYSKNEFYPNPNKSGGPLNPPKSVLANTGNNVYNKIYFPTAPTTPQCSHSESP